MCALIKEFLFANTENYHGTVDERFKDLATQFSRFQDARSHEGGAALVVYFQGQKVVDIFTGKKSQNEAWQADTLAMCYSTGKGILATLAHILVSEGLLDYDKPIAKYWPEFAQNNKENITLRHVLSHQTGLFDIRNLIETATEMLDWQHMLDVVAAATPRFAAGQSYAYQPLTYGWILGGVIEKAAKQPLSWLMQRYLVQPLELDGAYFGTPTSELSRVARLLERPKPATSAKPHSKKDKQPRKASLSEKLLCTRQKKITH